MGPIDLLIQNWMIPFLKFSYQSIYPNYGMSIILLTVLVKMVFYPLTKKQFVQMKVNQKIQPQIKEIQEKYKKQPEKMHKEMSALWKANNANPLSGCLPALVQLPFFFAIFYTMQSLSSLPCGVEERVSECKALKFSILPFSCTTRRSGAKLS